MTHDVREAKIAAHKANIRRYTLLLLTDLTETERAFLRKRMDEEQSALDMLSGWFDSSIVPGRAATSLAHHAA